MSFIRNKPLSSPIQGSLSMDVTLPADAEDTISSVSWSPVANHLAAASWDGKVRVYDVNANDGTARGVAGLVGVAPVLDCDWAKDGSMLVAGDVSKKPHLLHLATGQEAALDPHSAPIRSVRFVEVPGAGAPVLVTGSWDRSIRFYDLRQQRPFAAHDCKERVYAMDAKARLLVVATAGCRIHLIDLQNPTVIAKTQDSPLKHQTKAVAAFPDGKGWATASIEGRCGISAVDDAEASRTNFTFRCHREQPDSRQISKVWSVNDVRFHPVNQSVFTTAGSDGTFHFWDRVAHSRLKGYPSAGSAITSTAFNADGKLFAYAVGYDWSMGAVGNTPQVQTKLMLHPVLAEDAMPKKK
ncbi:WD40 repeat-like protein [Hypoxylon sp. FL1857]|nr:WD40 repeat-like protein [Hypoxylon sp. FL1857]